MSTQLSTILFTFSALFTMISHAHTFQGGILDLPLTNGTLTVTVHAEHAVEVVWSPTGGYPNPPAHALDGPPRPTPCRLVERGSVLHLQTDGMTVEIQRDPLHLRFLHQGRPLLETVPDETWAETTPRFRFQLSAEEKLFGAGSRVLGKMDRRGEKLDLYNSASYGYEDSARLMYYSMPAVVSSRKYLLAFDNGARGTLDLDSAGTGRLDFSAVGGRRAFLVVAGSTWPDLAAHIADTTGHQPMLPRWALGHIASRMGYHTQDEVETVVKKLRDAGYPLDAVVLDLFWFGASIFGNMGNLDWDATTFPEPIAMMDRLRAQGVQTILITEPLILRASGNWSNAVTHRALATNAQGQPYTFASFIGEAALVDVFRPEARDWFWSFYQHHTRSGVAGWWGDLGEPETHPEDIQHAIGRGDEVHNLYGHAWASLVYEGFRRDFPRQRPFILMRSGFVGTQRYGILPWSGDVKRSWGGFKSQIELTLQMGLQGVAYMHSDLGGFAGDLRDPELYVRWMQYGVFQPIYRPHAHETVPPEPVFWDEETQRIVRHSIRWRYRLLPYNYTLMFENATAGLPLMRPLMYADDRPALQDVLDTFLWGEAFLVAPITSPGALSREVPLPRDAVWLDYATGQRHPGGQTITVPVTLDDIPVFLRAGSFVPMTKSIQHTGDYHGRELDLHYYADPSVSTSSGQLYDDDGTSFDALATRQYNVIQFRSALTEQGGLAIEIRGEEHPYPGRPPERTFRLIVHGLTQPPQAIEVDSRPLDMTLETDAKWDAKLRELTLPLTWSGTPRHVLIRKPFPR